MLTLSLVTTLKRYGLSLSVSHQSFIFFSSDIYINQWVLAPWLSVRLRGVAQKPKFSWSLFPCPLQQSSLSAALWASGRAFAHLAASFFVGILVYLYHAWHFIFMRFFDAVQSLSVWLGHFSIEHSLCCYNPRDLRFCVNWYRHGQPMGDQMSHALAS
jgi:hypothetical protein